MSNTQLRVTTGNNEETSIDAEHVTQLKQEHPERSPRHMTARPFGCSSLKLPVIKPD